MRQTLDICKSIAGEVGAHEVVADRSIAKVSAVGEGMRTHTGVADRIFAALAEREINIQMISTSEIKVSCVIDASHGQDAMRAIHGAFRLADAPTEEPALPRVDATAPPVELPEMEGILVSDAGLSLEEAKITISGVADTPGVAARLFSEVAKADVNVNVIVQNTSEEGRTDVTFTVPKTRVEAALQASRSALSDVEAREVVADPDIAVVSLSGVGMRSHAGVARMMFAALAEDNINIQIISTSEVEIACVVDEASGTRALDLLKKTFDL